MAFSTSSPAAPSGGKSTIALSWSATVTRGGKWPDGQTCDPGRAVYWSGEDGIAGTLLPRFIAAGGNRDNMSFVEGVRAGERKRPFDPAADMPKLAKAIEKLGKVRRITLDPIAVMVTRDSHNNVETRIGLEPFADLCASRCACGLGVHHFTKNTSGGDPIDRISGSLAFGALPRCAWIAAKDLNVGKDARRVLIRAKMSNGPDWGGFDYKLDLREIERRPDLVAQRVLWGDAIEGTAKELLAQLESPPEACHAAEAFLREMLKDGPQMAAEIIAKGEPQGLSEWTLRRALKNSAGRKKRSASKALGSGNSQNERAKCPRARARAYSLCSLRSLCSLWWQTERQPAVSRELLRKQSGHVSVSGKPLSSRASLGGQKLSAAMGRTLEKSSFWQRNCRIFAVRRRVHGVALAELLAFSRTERACYPRV